MSGWRNLLDGINGRLNTEEERNSTLEAMETIQNEIQRNRKTENNKNKSRASMSS